jgi:hypothetical protein
VTNWLESPAQFDLPEPWATIPHDAHFLGIRPATKVTMFEFSGTARRALERLLVSCLYGLVTLDRQPFLLFDGVRSIFQPADTELVLSEFNVVERVGCALRQEAFSAKRILLFTDPRNLFQRATRGRVICF